jgi:hypothetical protein
MTTLPIEPVTQEEREMALQDLAYFNGAKQYAVIASDSEEAAQAWLAGGCGNRQSDAIKALRTAPLSAKDNL